MSNGRNVWLGGAASPGFKACPINDTSSRLSAASGVAMTIVSKLSARAARDSGVISLQTVTGRMPGAMLRRAEMARYIATGAVMLNLMAVMHVALLAGIVALMKGHGYVADAYVLPDSPTPRA